MFWGLVLEPSKSYAQVVDTPFHVSMAALDLKNSDNQEEASTLILRQDNTEYVLANLSKKNKIFNTPLGLDFDVGEEIEFFVQGQSQIHLTGFLAGDDNDDDLDDLNEEDEEENDLEQKLKDIRKAEAAKRKLKENSSGPVKRQKILDESFNDDTDEDDFDVDEDDLDDLEDEEDDSDDSEDIDDDDEDDDDEMEETSPPQRKKDMAAKPQQQQKQQQANAQSPESKRQKKKQKQLERQQQQQGNKQNNQQQKNQPNQANKTPQKNQQQQNKTPQKTPQTQGKTPQGKTPQPGNKQQNAKSPQGNGDAAQPGRSKRILKGGIVVEDIAEGSGKVATSNRMVGVYYVGRLSANKKEFDKNVDGKPFSFKLGRGEVIRGWDMGVEGMRVGGKRKLTIPAKFAYGNSGAPPAIPPNSTLEFEVTLVNVK